MPPPFLPYHIALFYDPPDSVWLADVYRGLLKRSRLTWSLGHGLPPGAHAHIEVPRVIEHARMLVFVPGHEPSRPLLDALNDAQQRVWLGAGQQRLVMVLVNGVEAPYGTTALHPLRLDRPDAAALVERLCALEPGAEHQWA